MSKREHIAGITKLPIFAPNMRIGLFGGSFNPPHSGHRMVSRQVMKRLQLDAIWWLVTPGNPLKDHADLLPLKQRVEQARKLITLPNVHITGFESAYGFNYTYQSLNFLKQRLKGCKLVWIMGADNLSQFHQWERHEEIAKLMPMVIYARPGSNQHSLNSRTATRLAKYRIDEHDAKLLPSMKAPAWVYLRGIMSGLSSSKIRAKK